MTTPGSTRCAMFRHPLKGRTQRPVQARPRVPAHGLLRGLQ